MSAKHGTKVNQMSQEDINLMVSLAIGQFAGAAIAGEIEGIKPNGKAVGVGIEIMREVITATIATRTVQLNLSQSTMDAIDKKAWEMLITKITENGKKAKEPAIIVPAQRSH